jgi:hypothetical protein
MNLVVVGFWLAIVGYGLAYSGMVTLGGGTCSLVDGFRGKCSPARTASASQPQSGATLLEQAQQAQRQQASSIGAAPIPQVA